MQFNGILELLLHRIKCRAGRRSPVTSGRGPHVCSLAQGPHATYEKYPRYAIAKKSMYYLQKASVPGPTAWKPFVTQIPTPLQILNTPCSP